MAVKDAKGKNCKLKEENAESFETVCELLILNL